jgi:hypothetical protein
MQEIVKISFKEDKFYMQQNLITFLSRLYNYYYYIYHLYSKNFDTIKIKHLFTQNSLLHLY